VLPLAAAGCGGSGQAGQAAAPRASAAARVGDGARAGSPAPAASARAPRPTPSTADAQRIPIVDGVGPIYARHLHGYDASFPQCSSPAPPDGAAFSIVGVNAGRAFTANPCLEAEWRAAPGTRAVYLNSGLRPENMDKTTADCRQRSQWQDMPDDRRAAYAIGCSEATTSLETMQGAGVRSPVMVWLDVESANSWDPVDLELNRVALQAEVDVLAASGRIVGLYAAFDGWRSIVGDWSPAGVVADWVAGRPADVSCSAPGFSGHPVWLAQELTTWDAGYDSDWSC